MGRLRGGMKRGRDDAMTISKPNYIPTQQIVGIPFHLGLWEGDWNRLNHPELIDRMADAYILQLFVLLFNDITIERMDELAKNYYLLGDKTRFYMRAFVQKPENVQYLTDFGLQTEDDIRFTYNNIFKIIFTSLKALHFNSYEAVQYEGKNLNDRASLEKIILDVFKDKYHKFDSKNEVSLEIFLGNVMQYIIMIIGNDFRNIMNPNFYTGIVYSRNMY